MNRNPRMARQLPRLLLIGALAGTSLPLVAQEESEQTQTVIVTGSYIPQPTDQGALPVAIITEEQIKRTGANTVEQLLQTLAPATQGNSNTVVASVAGVNSAGVSGISLRGLGSQRTRAARTSSRRDTTRAMGIRAGGFSMES